MTLLSAKVPQNRTLQPTGVPTVTTAQTLQNAQNAKTAPPTVSLSTPPRTAHTAQTVPPTVPPSSAKNHDQPPLQSKKPKQHYFNNLIGGPSIPRRISLTTIPTVERVPRQSGSATIWPKAPQGDRLFDCAPTRSPG